MIKSITIRTKTNRVKISETVLSVLVRYIQKGVSSVESGGVLIGKENFSNEDIVITDVTEPMMEDKQKFNRFYRRDKGHLEYFKKLYNLNFGTSRYIGEWHTHPEAYPNCSFMDIKNWRSIKNKGPDDADYYHAILGYEAVRIWEFKRGALKPSLIVTILWREIFKGEEN